MISEIGMIGRCESILNRSKSSMRMAKLTQIEISAGICGFTTVVRSEDKGGYKAVFQQGTISWIVSPLSIDSFQTAG